MDGLKCLRQNLFRPYGTRSYLPLHPALRLRLRARLDYSAPTHPNPRKRGANRGPGRRLFFALRIPPLKRKVSSHAHTEGRPLQDKP